MTSRDYATYETCTDSNAIYAAKVKRVCKQYVEGRDGLYNQCRHLDGHYAKVGDSLYTYSTQYCIDKGAHKLCRGFLGIITVHGYTLLAPDLKVDSKSPIVLPVAPPGFTYTANTMYHVDLYNSMGKYSDSGH